MKEWYGKFQHEIKLEVDRYVTITVDDEEENAQVLLFPHQAREVARELLKMADIAEALRKDE